VAKIFGEKNAPQVVTLGFIALWCVQQQWQQQHRSAATAPAMAGGVAQQQWVADAARLVPWRHLSCLDAVMLAAGKCHQQLCSQLL
jgi:hypothetical protein